MERAEIESLLPHRAPMLLVDRLVELEPGVRAVGTFEVRADAFWCGGHFPGNPILPGVLVTESMAQVAALAWLAREREHAGSTVYLVGLDKIRFRRPVRPGEVLRIEATVTEARHGMLRFDASATVDGQRVANGSFLATLEKRPAAPTAG